MRADRLLSLLLLLQARGRMTAERLAAELEVSERTIYRDIDALSAAGIPVYGERGPEGGYTLLDGYRTSLTGLTEAEMRAFFMLSIPTPLADLGMGQELRAALLKLSAAIPAMRREDEAWVRQRFYLDATWWSQADEPVPHLPTIHQAVWQDYRLSLTYWRPPDVEIEQTVDPYGLVAKAGVWYLVWARRGQVHAQRVSQLRNVRLLDERFMRPADFDLEAFWRRWCEEIEEGRLRYRVTVRVAPDFVPALPWYFGEGIRSRIAQAPPPDARGWITLELFFESIFEARSRILAFGRGVEVVEPEALRLTVLDFAQQIVGLYGRHSAMNQRGVQ